MRTNFCKWHKDSNSSHYSISLQLKFVSTNLELLMKRLNVILHSLDQLGLVLADGATNVRAHKEGVEA